MGEIYHEGNPYSKQMVVDSVLSAVSNNPLKNRTITGLVDDVIAPVEGVNASQAYAAGDELILNNLLYKAKSAIAQDTPFDAGSSGNIELAGSIVEQLLSLYETGSLMETAGYITNCNTSYTYPKNGLKVYLTSSDALNRPISETGAFWILEFGSQGNLYAVQVAFQSGGYMFMRRKSNNTWQAWKQIYPAKFAPYYGDTSRETYVAAQTALDSTGVTKTATDDGYIYGTIRVGNTSTVRILVNNVSAFEVFAGDITSATGRSAAPIFSVGLIPVKKGDSIKIFVPLGNYGWTESGIFFIHARRATD